MATQIDWEGEVEPRAVVNKPRSQINWEREISGASKAAESALPDLGGLLGRGASAVGEFIIEDIPEFVTGTQRTEFPDVRELGTSGTKVPPQSPAAARMAGAYASTLDEKGIANTAMKALQPHSKTPVTKHQDKHGNWMLNFDGEDFYINKPGLSEADWFQAAGQAGLFAPAARIAGAGKTILRRMLRGGALSGATSVGSDVLGKQLGSDMDVSYLRAAMSLGGGALFEGLSPLAGKALHKVGRAFSRRWGKNVTPDGTMTPRGRKTAEKNGVDPDDLQERIYATMRERTSRALAHEQEGALKQGQEFGLQYTKGQATQDFEQIAFEQAQRAARATEGGDIIRGFDTEQIAAREQAEAGVQARLGSTAAASPRDAGTTIGAGLQGGRGEAQRAADSAYRAVDESKGARFEPGNINTLWKNIKGDADIDLSVVDEVTFPNARRAVDDLLRLGKEVGKRGKADNIIAKMKRETDELGKPRASTVRMARVAFKQFEATRKRLNSRIKNATPGSDDYRVANRLKAHLDDWLDDAFDQGLFTGDPAILRNMKLARSAWSDLKMKYGSPGSKDQVEKIVEKMTRADVDGQQVVNWIFGRGVLDGAPDTSIAVAKHLRDKVFGRDSVEWGAVREAAWLKLTRNQATGKQLGPQALVTQIDRALHKQRGLLGVVFDDPTLIPLIKRYQAAVKRYIVPPGAANPSGTAGSLRRFMADLETSIRTTLRGMGQMAKISGDPVGGTSMFLASKVPLFRSGAARRAKEAIRRGMDPRNPPSPVATGAAQAVTRTAPTDTKTIDGKKYENHRGQWYGPSG